VEGGRLSEGGDCKKCQQRNKILKPTTRKNVSDLKPNTLQKTARAAASLVMNDIQQASCGSDVLKFAIAKIVLKDCGLFEAPDPRSGPAIDICNSLRQAVAFLKDQASNHGCDLAKSELNFIASLVTSSNDSKQRNLSGKATLIGMRRASLSRAARQHEASV
jgi:hypothetical protein